MTDSYHFQIEPEPRAEGAKYATWLDDYRAQMVESMNKLVELQFPSGATLKVAGDKIVGRVSGTLTGVKVTVAGGASYVPSMGGSVTVYCVGGGGGGGGSSSPVQRAPLPNSDEWRGIGHKAHDTFGADFIVTKGAEPTAPLYDSPTTDSAYPAIAGLLRG